LKKLEYQQENLKELINLTVENPTLNIVPMVNGEIVASDDFSHWMGSWGKPRIDEIFHDDERIYFKSQDLDELAESLSDNPAWCEECDEEQTYKEIEKYNWEKVILVHIELP
jgi:hypothetical protein